MGNFIYVTSYYSNWEFNLIGWFKVCVIWYVAAAKCTLEFE